MTIPNLAIMRVHSVEAAAQSSAALSAAPSLTCEPASAEATEKFKVLVDKVNLSKGGGALAHPGDSALAKIVAQQDAAASDIAQEFSQFQRDASLMGPLDLAAESVQLQFKMAQMMTMIEMGVGFAQGGKSAVQNLVKNQ